MNINDWLGRQFSNPPCWELVAAIYAEEVKKSVTGWKTINSSVRDIAREFRVAIHKNPDGFKQVDEPQDFALVLMGKSDKVGLHHIGVWYQGEVLHGLPEGNRYEELSVIKDTYPLIEYWILA